MKATVISVQKNVTKQGKNGPYDVHIFKYKPDDYDGHSKPPIERPIFVSNKNCPDLPDKIAALTANDYVELDFVKNGDYTNIIDVTVISQGQQQQQQQQQSSAPSNPPPATDYEKKKDAIQTSIIRQVALKAGVAMVTALLAKEGHYRPNTLPPYLIEEVIQFADGFEAYVLNVNRPVKEEENKLSTKNSPPFNPDDDIPF